MAKAELDASSFMNNLTFEVKIVGMRKLEFKIKIATMLIRLATRILGCGVNIEIQEKKGGSSNEQ